MKKLLTLIVILASLPFFGQTELAEKKWTLTHYLVDSKKTELPNDQKNTVLYLKKDFTYEFYSNGDSKKGIWYHDPKTSAFILRPDDKSKGVYEFKTVKANDSELVIETKNGDKVVRSFFKA